MFRNNSECSHAFCCNFDGDKQPSSTKLYERETPAHKMAEFESILERQIYLQVFSVFFDILKEQLKEILNKELKAGCFLLGK